MTSFEPMQGHPDGWSWWNADEATEPHPSDLPSWLFWKIADGSGHERDPEFMRDCIDFDSREEALAALEKAIGEGKGS